VIPPNEWIVAIDASTTLTTNRSQFAYAAGTIAIDGTLQHSGFRLKLEGLGGNYGYNQAGTTAEGKQFEGAALAGYQSVWNNATIAFYVGLNIRDNTIPSANSTNAETGTAVGFKTAFDAYLRPTDLTMLSAYASYSTAYDAY
jgi:cellulose biosynthesis protein BcsS